VDALSNEIKELVGYPTPTGTPLVQPTATPSSQLPNARSVAMDIGAQGGEVPGEVDTCDMILAIERSEELQEMHSTIPRTLRLLVKLRDEVVTRLKRIDADVDDPAELERQLRILAAAPSRWPADSHEISSDFGYRTIFGRLGFHQGIDIPLWYGRNVYATQDGKVVAVGWRTTLGWTVEIEHALGFRTLYAHNSKRLVSVGDEVKAGDVICRSGNSGLTPGPHLHYEIHLNGTPVDPLKYLESGTLASTKAD